MTALSSKPPKFLVPRVRVITPKDVPPVLAMCAGYDEQRWRARDLAEHLCHWFPEWALRWGEWKLLEPGTMMEMARRAALKVYTSENYKGRGEFGELMLHAIIRHEFETEPAISKIYFKDAPNDIVKGFDCVHVSTGDDGRLDLWLGEAKFYTRIGKAILSAAKDLREHLKRDWLRSEFLLICDKLDDEFPLAAEIREMLRAERPLDAIFESVRLPILLAYDSKTVKSHTEVCAAYEAELETEAVKIRERLLEELGDKPAPREVSLELILLPVEDKKQLIEMLDHKLREWQGRT